MQDTTHKPKEFSSVSVDSEGANTRADKIERVYCADPSAKASETCREFISKGWSLVDGYEGHEISRALGCAWPFATLVMRRNKEHQSFRFVGKQDNNIFLYSH